MGPLFSIIIPAYNRAPQLERALRSVHAQQFTDYEVIVVDDCSTDDTLAVARRFESSAMRLVRRRENGGPCQARNSGIDIARGRWLAMLDSDFTFRDVGALSRLAVWCTQAPPEIGNCTSACAWDNGWLTPRPAPPTEMDYVAYLQWLEGIEISEYFNCIRREVFARLRYARSRAWETSFHLGLAKSWRLRFHAEPLVLIHTDAPNRLTTGKGRPAYRRMLADAPAKRADFAAIFVEHGDLLVRYAPRLHSSLRREAMKQALLAGARRDAWQHWRAARVVVRDRRQLAVFLLGLIHGRLLAWANSLRFF